MRNVKLTLLLTSCIDPSDGAADISRSNPRTRMNDYKKSVRKWLECEEDRIKNIVFIDNSGYGVEEIKEVCHQNNEFGRNIEVMSFNGNYYPDKISYGYAELGIIDYAFQESKLLNDTKFFLKCTGRLFYPKISELLDKLNGNLIFAVDSRSNSPFRKGGNKVVTTQLMLFRTNFYQKKIVGVRKKMDKEIHHIEILFYKELKRYRKSDKALFRWPISILPVGYSAHWGRNYRSFKKVIISSIRNILRKIFPSWWI